MTFVLKMKELIDKGAIGQVKAGWCRHFVSYGGDAFFKDWRIENFGDNPGECVVRLWNRRQGYNPYGDEQYFIPETVGSHGGADPSIVAEFIRYVRKGDKISTSAIAARNSVAAGCLAAHSLRNGGMPMEVPKVPEEIAEHFNADVKK